MVRRGSIVAVCVCMLAAAMVLAGAGDKPKAKPTTKPAGNLEFWLSRAKPTTQPAETKPAENPSVNPFAQKSGFRREDAVPGVIELSDGRQIAGGVYGTREKPYSVFVEAEKRWRRIPLIAVLSITPVVVGERMELEWRWREMGAPERVYTGRKYPWRRFLWKFHLIDGSYITGAIKGKPIRVETGDKTISLWILAERTKGPIGTTLKDLVYIRQVIISRKMMEKVQAYQREKEAE